MKPAAVDRAYIGTENPGKGPFSVLLVGWPTIPNGPRYRPGPDTPETGVDRGVGLVTRVGSPTRPLDPAQALRHETVSGPPISHRMAR